MKAPRCPRHGRFMRYKGPTDPYFIQPRRMNDPLTTLDAGGRP